MIVSIVGWTLLFASIIVPEFIQDRTRARFVGAALAACATGIFIGAILAKIT